MNDAGFMDAEPGPLMLRAEDERDLAVISALVQDAVLPITEISYDARARRLALLVNRFRWEDAEAAEREERDFERVRALIVIGDVTAVRSDGIARDDADLVLSLLALRWQGGADGSGQILLDFAGDGAIAADVECVAVDLRDVSRPYVAPSGKKPSHDLA